VHVRIARAPAAHVIHKDQAAGPGDPNELGGDGGRDPLLADAAEERERQRDVERGASLGDDFGAAFVDADSGRPGLAVGDESGVDIDGSKVFRARAPLQELKQVVPGRTTGFEGADSFEDTVAVLEEDAQDEPLTLLHHEQVAHFQAGVLDGGALRHSAANLPRGAADYERAAIRQR
jgi:hypothetical protein